MNEKAASMAPEVQKLARCDLVMQGGITSGVVYPGAVLELASKYRFENIGGASVGAIAAAITAAAEYGRQNGHDGKQGAGFGAIKAVPRFLGKNLLSLFQPHQELKSLFSVFVALGKRDRSAIIQAVASDYRGSLLLGAIAGIGFATAAIGWPSAIGEWFVAGVFGLIGAISGLLTKLYYDAFIALPKHDFGMCPGATQDGYNDPALCNWMADIINQAAGRAKDDPPLTIADLKEKGITLQTTTTDLTTRRSYTLPITTNEFAFKPKEFKEIFPDKIVNFMRKSSSVVNSDTWGKHNNDDEEKLYYFSMDNLPIVVCARLSLSFPILFKAVPLYRVDYLRPGPVEKQVVRCLFSDGGISSNFPVHFFDRFLPDTPTFGIALGELNQDKKCPPPSIADRIFLPIEPRAGRLLPTQTIKGLSGFAAAILENAKDWQDTLQSTLVGYRERIVTIKLEENEGGLNLAMPKPLIDQLSEYGVVAGKRIVDEFNIDDHRWRRFLTEMPALERALMEFAEGWDSTQHAQTYPDIVKSGDQRDGYDNFSTNQLLDLHARGETLAQIGRVLCRRPAQASVQQRVPQQRTRLQNRPDLQPSDP
jgi:predicted acylesterase/phospholipase RssA